jgi:hypothetical protein
MSSETSHRERKSPSATSAAQNYYAERQRSLKTGFKFDCRCELCSLPPAQRKRSDARLRKMRDLDSRIGTFFSGGALGGKDALGIVHSLLDLFCEEGIWDGGTARAYNDAYKIAENSGDRPRARIFAERTWEARCVIDGVDSPLTMKMKRLVEKLSSAQTPQGMSETEFEKWL